MNIVLNANFLTGIRLGRGQPKIAEKEVVCSYQHQLLRRKYSCTFVVTSSNTKYHRSNF